MDRNEWEVKMNNEDINFRQSNPIEYVLQCLMQGIDVEKFDIRNALDQWNKIKIQTQNTCTQTDVCIKARSKI